MGLKQLTNLIGCCVYLLLYLRDGLGDVVAGDGLACGPVAREGELAARQQLRDRQLERTRSGFVIHQDLLFS